MGQEGRASGLGAPEQVLLGVLEYIEDSRLKAMQLGADATLASVHTA
jgi:hypothetical protein